VKGTEHNFGTHITFIGFETHKKWSGTQN
jgi:hypothetical protein